MPLGPGKYDDLCTRVRKQAKARGAIVIVIEGGQGGGFSVQADIATTIRLPEILETVAKEIRLSLERGELEAVAKEIRLSLERGEP